MPPLEYLIAGEIFLQAKFFFQVGSFDSKGPRPHGQGKIENPTPPVKGDATSFVIVAHLSRTPAPSPRTRDHPPGSRRSGTFEEMDSKSWTCLVLALDSL